MMKKEELIAFEQSIVDLFHAGKIPYPIHLSGGNETQLIEIFKGIRKPDWVFSSWRSHYHYLLKSGNPVCLERWILAGNSMHIMDNTCNFFSSSIVAGCCPIAVGVAKAIQMRGGKEHVYVFVGDGAEDEGVFYESVRYVEAWKLPCSFIIEDNGLSVCTTALERINDFTIEWPSCVSRYYYERKWPHCQTGQFVPAYGTNERHM